MSTAGLGTILAKHFQISKWVSMASANADKDGKAPEMHAFSAAESARLGCVEKANKSGVFQNRTTRTRVGPQHRAGQPGQRRWQPVWQGLILERAEQTSHHQIALDAAIDTEKRTHTQEPIDEVIHVRELTAP
ncbi:hypothetical protein Aduo_011988 [Ancylostoma duodenale]